MTLGARRDRHIRFQPAQRSGFRDVDVTRRTFRDVLFLLTTTIVYELRGDPCRRFIRGAGRCEFVTTVTVAGDWLLRLPVTVETRSMICRPSLRHRGPLPMTDGAIVVALRHVRESQQRDHILMLVMRK